MSIAVVSCGPSLKNVPSDYFIKKYDTVITINKSASKFNCNYWVCGDQLSFIEIPIDDPIRVTIPDVAKRLRRIGIEAQVINLEPADCFEVVYSLNLAIKFAGDSLIDKAYDDKEIDVYGVDWLGNDDLTGEVNKYIADRRNNGRWEKEKGFYFKLVEYLNSLSIEVNRCQTQI